METIVRRIQNGDNLLIEDFINQNINFINSFVNKYNDIFEDYEDLLQEAILAFISAIYNYKFDKNSFRQFASIKIYSTILKYVHENLYRILDNEKRYEIVKTAYDKCKKFVGHEPSCSDISYYFRVARSHALQILLTYSLGDIYLEIEDYKDYYEDYSLENIESRIDSEIFIDTINNSNLTQKQKEVILYKYGFIDGICHSLKSQAEKNGVNRQATHDVYKGAIKKLSLILNKNY